MWRASQVSVFLLLLLSRQEKVIVTYALKEMQENKRQKDRKKSYLFSSLFWFSNRFVWINVFFSRKMMNKKQHFFKYKKLQQRQTDDANGL